MRYNIIHLLYEYNVNIITLIKFILLIFDLYLDVRF